jgi:hypothetical protein
MDSLIPHASQFTDKFQQIEAECLKELGPFRINPDQASTFQYVVRTPKRYLYDDVTNTQIQEYLPSGIDLKTYALQNFPSPTPEALRPQCHQLGKALAQYITGFNGKTDAKLHEELRRNKEMQALKHMINYDWLLQRVDQFPGILEETREVFVNVKEQALDELNAAPGELKPIHGDFWPGK